jgi:hypothetical protein
MFTAFWTRETNTIIIGRPRAVAWSLFLVRNQSTLVTTEAVLWEWMNALSDALTRRLAAEGYPRCQSDARIEVVPFGGANHGSPFRAGRSES